LGKFKEVELGKNRHYPNKFREIEKATGKPIADVIAQALEEEGSELGAAMRLGVAPNALRNWRMKNGYEVHKSARLVKVAGNE
jgi:hypothetical protein